MVTTALPRGRVRANALQRGIVRAYARDALVLIPVFQRDLIAAFGDLGARARRAYLNLTPRPIRQTDPGDRDRVDAILRGMGTDDWTDRSLSPSYRAAMIRTGAMTTGTASRWLGGLFVDLPDHVGRRVVAEGGRRIGLVDIRGQSRRALFHALAEGRAQGMAREQLANHIAGRITRGPYRSVETRALVIARTETLHAQRVSALEVYRRTEVVTGMLAFDAQVGATDAECEDRNQRVYSFRDADLETSLEHPNGTLSWAPYSS